MPKTKLNHFPFDEAEPSLLLRSSAATARPCARISLHLSTSGGFWLRKHPYIYTMTNEISTWCKIENQDIPGSSFYDMFQIERWECIGSNWYFFETIPHLLNHFSNDIVNVIIISVNDPKIGNGCNRFEKNMKATSEKKFNSHCCTKRCNLFVNFKKLVQQILQVDLDLEQILAKLVVRRQVKDHVGRLGQLLLDVFALQSSLDQSWNILLCIFWILFLFFTTTKGLRFMQSDRYALRLSSPWCLLAIPSSPSCPSSPFWLLSLCVIPRFQLQQTLGPGSPHSPKKTKKDHQQQVHQPQKQLAKLGQKPKRPQPQECFAQPHLPCHWSTCALSRCSFHA